MQLTSARLRQDGSGALAADPSVLRARLGAGAERTDHANGWQAKHPRVAHGSCVASWWFRASRLLRQEGQEPRRPASHLGEASAWSSTALRTLTPRAVGVSMLRGPALVAASQLRTKVGESHHHHQVPACFGRSALDTCRGYGIVRLTERSCVARATPRCLGASANGLVIQRRSLKQDASPSWWRYTPRISVP
jgi:hypothetical protein